MFERSLRGGVILKLVERHHADMLFAAVDRNREYLRTWLPWVDRTLSVNDIKGFIETTLQQFARNEGFVAGIWAGPEMIGTLGLHKIDWDNRKVELGYWLAEGFQGRGIMTEACRAVIDHIVSTLKLNRVEVHCATGNKRSRAIPERLGFTFEGTRREGQIVNGRVLDIEVYSMLAAEWRRIQ